MVFHHFRCLSIVFLQFSLFFQWFPAFSFFVFVFLHFLCFFLALFAFIFLVVPSFFIGSSRVLYFSIIVRWFFEHGAPLGRL